MPVLNSFLKVHGAFETATSARVHSPPIILLHIRLHSIKLNSHFTMVAELLSEYFHNNNQLQVIDMPFNVGHNQAVPEWSKAAAKVVKEVSGFSHVVIFVTTHLVPKFGDLWLGNDPTRNKPCAATVSNVSAALFNYLIDINYILNSGLMLFFCHSSPYSAVVFYTC